MHNEATQPEPAAAVGKSAVQRFVMCDMNEAEIKALCEKIARDVMALGDEPDSPAQRMQYMGGEWPDNEREQGGVCEKALATFLAKSMNKHLST